MPVLDVVALPTLPRGIVGRLLQTDAPVVITDMEAGLEHLGRGTTEHADALLIVIEPYYRALETGRRVEQLARELGMRPTMPATKPRWDRLAMEGDCTARMWTTAMAQVLPHRRFLEPTSNSLKILVPHGQMPESEMEWHIPQEWNAFERNRGRAYCIPYSTMVAMDNRWLPPWKT